MLPPLPLAPLDSQPHLSTMQRRVAISPSPKWVRPQLTQLVDAAPDGNDWLHEIKYDGYRMHARLDRGAVKLLTRTGLDWTHKYPAIAKAVAALDARQAYLDGELCGVGPDGVTLFNRSTPRLRSLECCLSEDVRLTFLAGLVFRGSRRDGSGDLGTTDP